jgi:hypothetical protein
MAAAVLENARALLVHAASLPRLVAFDRQRARRGRVHRVGAPDVPGHVARALDDFERTFVLQLTTGERYLRLHGPDFGAYHRSIGRSAVTLVLFEDGAPVGTQSLIVKRFHVPRRRRPVRFVYALNTRVRPEARFGAALARLQLAGFFWALPRCWRLLTLIPDAVATPPRSRTGRHGIPAIRPIAHIERVQVPLDRSAPAHEADRCVTNAARVLNLRRRLNRDRVYTLDSRPDLRSLRTPVWLALPDGSACGCVEDFLRVRRFAGADGAPDVVWPGLTHVAADSTGALERLIRVAAVHAGRVTPDPLTATTDRDRAAALRERLGLEHPRVPLSVHASACRSLPEVPWEFDVTEI